MGYDHDTLLDGLTKWSIRCAACSWMVTCWTLAVAAPVVAQSAAVLDFKGPRRGAVRRQVVDAFEARDFTVTSRKVTRRAERRRSTDLRTREGRAALAERLEVNVLVRGWIRGRRLRLTVYNEKGADVARGVTRLRRGARGKRDVKRMVDKVVATLHEVPSADDPDDGDDSEDLKEEDSDRAVDRAGARAAPAKQPAVTAQEAAAEKGEQDHGTVDTLRRRVATLLVGGGVRSRGARLNLIDNSRRSFSPDPFAQLALWAMFRPAPQGTPLGGLYGDLVGAFGFVGSSQDSLGEDVDATAFHLRGTVGYVFELLSGFELGGGVGLGYDAFSLSDNAVITSSNYGYFRPELVARVRLGTPAAVLRFFVGGRFIFSLADYSPRFATSVNSVGGDAGLALTGTLDAGFSYALDIRVVRYALGFEGAGDVVSETAIDGYDQSLMVNALVGWAF